MRGLTPPQILTKAPAPRSGEGLSSSPFPTREGGWGVRFSEFANNIYWFVRKTQLGGKPPNPLLTKAPVGDECLPQTSSLKLRCTRVGW